MSQLRNVKGTRDLLPEESVLWTAVEACARDVFGRYGFGEIRTPILEDTALFVRGVGESSDIVGKEMYTFDDRKGRSLTLRPESTASVARAYIQHRLQERANPGKLFYIGPQFRYERPQRGRYRQFQQIGAEVLGDAGPASDAELLVMLLRFLRALGFDSLEVRLNTVGDAESRQRFSGALRSYLEPVRDELGEDSQRRLETNPLRILDTKNPRERALLVDAPKLTGSLSDDCRAHFDGLLALLDRFEVPYSIDDGLVRGLDYYTRTVFEIASADLGAQDAILGGGRYDRLVSDLGGPAVPGIGFAIGQDRLLDVLPESFRSQHRTPAPVVVVPVGLDRGAEVALEIAEELRTRGVQTVAELSGRAMGAALRQANKLDARGVVLVGEDELAAGTLTYKNFSTGDQTTVEREALLAELSDARDSHHD